MNDFDRLLESQLRRPLDPVVASPIPVRRTQIELRRTEVMQSAIELALVPETMLAAPVEVYSWAPTHREALRDGFLAELPAGFRLAYRG